MKDYQNAIKDQSGLFSGKPVRREGVDEG